MNDQREAARMAAVNSRQTAANRQGAAVTESVFRTAVLDGIQRIRQLYDSDSAMARATGVSQPTINKVLSGKQEPRLDAVGKIMDTVGATVTFPWEARNTTKRVAVSGAANLAEFRTVSRFVYEDGALRETDETAVILPLAQLQAMSESLSLGAFVLGEEARLPIRLRTGRSISVIVDFSKKPASGDEEEDIYLAVLKDGTLCVASAWDGRLLVGAPGIEKSPVKGSDYDDVESAVIGKVVFTMTSL